MRNTLVSVYITLATYLVLLILISGCVTPDISTKAYASNDLTMFNAACSSVPVGGLDICRVKEGSKIQQEWLLLLPRQSTVDAGELTVCYKDICKVYSLSRGVSQISVPFNDLIREDVWSKEHDGIVQATGFFQFDVDGVTHFVQVLGFAHLIVLQKGYNPVPIDSGYEAITINCKRTEVQYTTSGRSAIKCKD